MDDRADWNDLRERRMAEPGAAEAYEAARIAFELGQTARELRERAGRMVLRRRNAVVANRRIPPAAPVLVSATQAPGTTAPQGYPSAT
ncbi:hypothetical protein [Micromonospora cremea]|uniref:Uncharacterized protein n=1 Tax=Micromonospora cremea TaxID=709881 RepID=A0A1N6AMZ3_9ACTN|nr:hypothetical protein [Micromonospora cremea]SIN35405.1 hypothetical protein SAMN04489832_5802 [Micromonospora cremea]